MKKYLFIILFVSVITSCNGQSQKLIVKTDSDLKEIRYWPLNGEQLPYYDLSTVVGISTEEITEIILPQGECLYNMLIGNKSFKIYATTGSVDTIHFYSDILSFTGDNKRYNHYLMKAEKSDTYCRDYSRNRKHELREMNNLSDFQKIVDSLKLNDDLLLTNERFSRQFVKQQKLFTEMRYNALFLKKTNSLYRTPDLTDEWIDELKNRDFLLTNECSRQSEWFYSVLEDYVLSKSIMIEDVSLRDIMNSYNDFLYDRYGKILSGNNLEYALGCLFYDDIFQEEYSKDIPSLYDRFITLYPGSPYIELLKPGIKRIEDLYRNHDDSCIFVVNYEAEPENFEDMIRPFSGKVVYIDIWATSCSPCLKAFSQLDNLKEKVSGIGDIVFFYISLDRDRDHEKWQRMSGYYNLNGYHYRVNEQTSKIIYSSLGDSGGMLSIPRYVLVDKNGKIAFAYAASPSEADKVIDQLTSLLK